MRYCKDCKHILCTSTKHFTSWEEIDESYLYCEHPLLSPMEEDPIFGGRPYRQRSWWSPRSIRRNEELCGMDAKWFESREGKEEKPLTPPVPRKHVQLGTYYEEHDDGIVIYHDVRLDDGRIFRQDCIPISWKLLEESLRSCDARKGLN